MPFRPATFEAPRDPTGGFNDPGFCKDGHPECGRWASAGECEKNAEFMARWDVIMARASLAHPT